MSVMKTGLAMIEGIYGRDGDGFDEGQDYLTNLVMFSKDKFRLDMIGMYLGGHEPGNVHLFRIAKERGLTDTFNPWEIPDLRMGERRSHAAKTHRLCAHAPEDLLPAETGRAALPPGERALRLRPLQSVGVTLRLPRAATRAAPAPASASSFPRKRESSSVLVSCPVT